MTVNFDELRKSNPTFRCNGWCKSVTSLDKSTPTGYSLIGEFQRKGKGDFNYLDGVYLDCSKPQGEKNYHIFVVEDGEPTVLQTLENPQGRWATELWDTIDKALSESPKFSEEYQAQQLANLVLENCGNTSILNKVARIISQEYNDEPIIRNSQMMYGLLGSQGVRDYPMAIRWGNRPLDESSGIVQNLLNYEKALEDGYTEHQAIFKTYVECDHDWKKTSYTLDDIREGKVEVDFKVITEFEAMEEHQFNKYIWNHWYFKGDHFGGDEFLKNFIILGYHKGDKWEKPSFFVRVFTDELWNNFCGVE